MMLPAQSASLVNSTKYSLYFKTFWTSLVAQTVKNLPAMQETQVRSLGRVSGEGNDHPLQYSCLENSMDRGARYIHELFTIGMI